MKKEKFKDNIICFCAITFFVLFFGFAIIATAEPIDEEETKTETITAKVTLFEDIPLDLDLIEHIQGLCDEYYIPIEIALAVIEQESSYQSDAVSYIGAKGLMQVQEKYHKDRMKKLGCTDLFDPYQNTTVGMDYLAELLTYYNGNFEMMLVAYNRGQTGAYNEFFSKGIYESNYSREVLERVENIKEGMTEMFVTDDAVRDFMVHDAEQTAALEKMPVCEYCLEHIQDDFLYEINDEVICEECIKDNFRKNVEDYIK